MPLQKQGVTGNQVQILSDPVAVTEELPSTLSPTHFEEDRRKVMIRKPEDLPSCYTKNAFGGKEWCAMNRRQLFVMSFIKCVHKALTHKG